MSDNKKMKEAVISANLDVTIQDVDRPSHATIQHLIIRVIAAALNPKDWAMSERCSRQGDDVAGVVVAVGSDVVEFRPGDRVASFHQMLTPYGGFGEYAIGLAATTFHIPKQTSFEEAATIPLAAMTAALGLYQRLGLPLPWRPVQSRCPLAIYGASSAVGAFAVKLAVLSNIHPLLCVAGAGSSFVETLIDRSQGDIVIDHRRGDENLVASMQAALGAGQKLHYAFDAVTDKGSFQNLVKVMDVDGGRLAVVLARKKYDGVPPTIKILYTQVGKAHSRDYPGLKGDPELLGDLSDEDFAAVMYRFLARGLSKGWFAGHPQTIVPHGLRGLGKALHDLKEGHASATKFVVRIADTDAGRQTHL